MKKNKALIIILTSVLLFLCFFMSMGQNYARAADNPPTDDNISLKFGILGEFGDLDPHKAYDRSSWYIIDQTIETLYMHNLTDPELGVVPRLAAAIGNWSIDKLNHTVILKQDIIFHDGTLFDAYAVKWNFDRLAYFMNISGTLPSSNQVTTLDYLYRFQDGTPIINKTVVINPLTIRFILNRPYTAFEALLCFGGSGILSPASTSQIEYLDRLTSDLVGTGPFVYDGYIENVEITFHSFKNYSAGVANIDNLTFSIFQDSNNIEQALSTGEIQFYAGVPTTMVDTFINDPNIVVKSGKSTTAWYLGMNNKQINKTMRQAISYAINYSYIINIIKEGQAARLKSHIPDGILYANSEYNIATMNITEARKRLINAGVCNFNIENDTEWEIATEINPIATYKFSYPTSTWREDLGILLTDNLANIGIKVINEELSMMDWWYRIMNIDPYSRDMLQLFDIGWAPDFNDPHNIVDPLLSVYSPYNFVQADDPYLENLMAQAAEETNPVIRESFYDTIQQNLVEDLMPYAYLFVTIDYVAYNNNFTGFKWNPLGIIRFQDVARIIKIDTPEGTDIELVDQYHGLNMTFNEITNSGVTSITSSNSGTDPKTGFGLAGKYYNITTTADFTGNITFSFSYDENEINCDETELKLMHWDSELEEWIDVTTGIDMINNVIYGATTNFSTFSIVQPDTTPPTSKLTKSGTLGQENWYSSDVYVILSAIDDLSKIEKIEYSFDNTIWFEYSQIFSITTEGETMIYFRSTDTAGNVENIKSTIIKIDKSSPQTSIQLNGLLGENGWYTSDVSIDLGATDSLSGVASIKYSLNNVDWTEYTGSISISAEKIQKIYYKSIDKAGNIELVKSKEVKIDKSAPETIISLTGDFGLDGWFKSNVTVTFTATDDTSGLKFTEYSYDGFEWQQYLGGFNVTSEGITSIYYTSTDKAGNTELVKLKEIQIDKTAPETELIISPVLNEEEVIYVSNDSTFILVGLDNFSGVSHIYYKINESEWIEFTDFFTLDGTLGEYTIYYYSIDIAGNIESLKFTIVILVEDFGEEFQGFGIIQVNGQRIIGSATLSLLDDTIQMEIEDQIVNWNVTDYIEIQNLEIYTGEGELGIIKVIVIRFENCTSVIAYGTGIFFIGCS